MAHKRLHTFTSSTEHDFTGLLQNQILIFDGDNIVSTGSTNTSGNIWSSSTGQHSIISNNNSNNIASGGYSVSFGYNNSINDGDSSSNSFVGGGSNNEIEGMNSSVIGGVGCFVFGDYSFVGSGQYNTAKTINSTTIGGSNNLSNGVNSSILGGNNNSVISNGSSIISSTNSTLSGSRSVILGGLSIVGTSNDTVYVPSISFQENTSNRWVIKEIEIGEWDMYNTADVQIPHNLSSTEWLTIRMVDVLIVNDLNDLLLKLNTPDLTGRASGGILNINSTNINLFRVEGYVFDDVNYTGPNELGRGWITFWYKPD